jgi:N-terminal acetyltransferase B complex non-catalytic subunit
MRDILLKLAHRLITACWKQVEVHPDRLYLHTSILQQLGLYEDARELLGTESGRFFCARNLSCDHLRREIMKAGGWQMEEGGIAEQRIVEKRSATLQYTEYTCHLEIFAGIATGSSLSLF